MLQSYDWLHLHKEHNCSVQIGGSDQLGNIEAGSDLIRRVRGDEKEVYGLTIPLVKSESGAKLGKTAGTPVWLSPERTSDFDFYQYFLRCVFFISPTELNGLM